jgi:hypothetical protein
MSEEKKMLNNLENFLDFKPPWVTFAYLTPQTFAASLKQGETELWVDQHWHSFWAKLNAEQRSDYLNHWQADSDWIEAIEFSFGNDADFDVEVDSVESKLHLDKYRSDLQVEQNKSFFRRLFKK